MIPTSTNPDFERFNFLLRPYVECLVSKSKEKINLTNDPLRVIDQCSGCLNTQMRESQTCDRFTLKIPFAQQVLTWQTVFDNSDLKEPPDFIFDAEDYDFQPPLEEIKSLMSWDWQNCESLHDVVAELLDHYNDYQLERAGANPNLQRHLRSLLAQKHESMQLIVNRAERGLGTLNCLVRMELDFSRLPPYLTEESSDQAHATLHLCVPYPESSSIQAQLFLSPSVEFVFGGSSTLRIPPYQAGMLMGEYVATVKNLMENQIKIISDGYEKRKEYVAAFINHFGQSVLEYDVQSCKKLSLLWEWNDFFFTFTVELPLYFPNEPPTYILKSVYHSQNKRPYTERFTDFPYSPRWNGNEMARRASSFILDVIKDFQKASVNQSDR